LNRNEQEKRPATINEVAALAKVSIKTVSRVLNSEPNVRPQTRDRVLSATKQLNYRPNLSARRLASNRSFVIGLLYDNPQSDYVTTIQEGCLEVCRKEGYHLLIHPCRRSSPEFLSDIMGLHSGATSDGFILTQPVSELESLTSTFIDRNIPFVRISQRESDISHCISVDDVLASSKMTEHLIELGHRRIGFIMGHPDHGSSHDRLLGYTKALDKHGIPRDEALIEQGLYSFESGYSCARRLLSPGPQPTAIFASNDHMAMGVLTAAHEKKILVPSQLSVCGFDDTPMARYAWPPLTTLRQPIKQVARLATEVLLSLIRKGEDTESDYQLHSELIKRSSSGPARPTL